MNFPSKTIIIYTHLLVGGSALISMPVELGQAAGGTCSQDHTQASKRIHGKCRLKGVTGWGDSVRVSPLLDKKSRRVQWETNMNVTFDRFWRLTYYTSVQDITTFAVECCVQNHWIWLASARSITPLSPPLVDCIEDTANFEIHDIAHASCVWFWSWKELVNGKLLAPHFVWFGQVL